MTVTDPYQRLDHALDALDTVLAPSSTQPFTVGGCTFCYSPADLEALAGPVDRVPEELILSVADPGAQPVTGPLETISVSTGTLAPWLDIWAETRTLAADQHLRDALDNWLVEWQLADLHFGFYDEFHATPQLLPWLLTLDEGRLDAAQLVEVEHIAHS
ncbi:hypothetical protein [Nonomuraea jiangxiensis]|uniref:Uncharacterized protein n=1 Tax=Nonomuraea jiangxiensis TaxID=633440 RepID=A0A1G9WHY0_9ACTN|nr:hypothetical protein [Nonomuraea jiangxiensis]SDM83781.1 hypothetical protein SAMN05421869_15911 [Nonomuraea jiangxiensis]